MNVNVTYIILTIILSIFCSLNALAQVHNDPCQFSSINDIHETFQDEYRILYTCDTRRYNWMEGVRRDFCHSDFQALIFLYETTICKWPLYAGWKDYETCSEKKDVLLDLIQNRSSE